MDSFIFRGRRGCHIHIPALHFTQLAQQIAILDCRSTTSICPAVFESRSQFSNDLEVFLDSEDGEVTIKEFCQGIMRLGLQSALCAFPKHALLNCELDTFKALLPRTEGASTCFGRDLHHACQSLRKMTGGRQESLSVHDCRSRNSRNITKSLPKDVTLYCYYFHFGHVQETGINHPHTPGPR